MRAQRKAGRPSKWTPTIRAKLVANVRHGLSYKRAAVAAGISESLFSEWRAAGTKGEPGFAEFLAELQVAEAESEKRALEYIGKHRDWRARAWLLSRRYPDRYADRQTIQSESTLTIRTPEEGARLFQSIKERLS